MHSVSASLPSSTDVNDGSTLIKRNQNCQATDESTGESCGETKGLHILDEFRKLYESRIEKVDRISDGESDRVSMKLQIMSDWIKDLGEQNTMLVHTVEDLEQAACSRVKMLEEKLKQSSQIVVDNLTRSNHSEKALNTLSNRVSQLEKDEKYLQQKIEYLQSDIRGLLEVIRRARQQNVWSLEGITFLEIQPENIPIPIADCICGQEQTDIEHVKSLNLQVEQFQENEKKMLRSQFELEEKIAVLKTELSMKDETIKNYISRLQCFYEKLKEHVKQTNQIISHSLITSDQDCNIILIPDILESILDAKDTENRNLRRQLQHVESKLMVHTYENNIDATNLKVQLEEKSNKVQQLEEKVAQLEKKAEKTQDTLTAEIATLEKQNYHANVGNLLKDDLIKEMRKELKEATLEDTSSRKVYINTNNLSEENSLPLTDITHSKDEFISFLNSTKNHVQKECEILSSLKLELEKFLEKLTIKDDEVCLNGCIMSNNCANKNKHCVGISDKLVNCIEIIIRMYSEREKEISLFDCMIKKEDNHCVCGDSKDNKSNVNTKLHFKLMEEFRICTVEAQAATEDIREEINAIVSIFNTQYQSYEELNKMATSVQSYLARTREGLIEAINRLELQEEERLRHSERIVNGKDKLKDIKNEINLVQSELSRCINGIQEDIQKSSECGYTETYVSNDLLTMLTEEVEQILINLQLFQTQGGCVTSTLKGLRSQLCIIDCSLKDLQKKADEVLLNNEVSKTIFCERESRLGKLEEEIDCTHTKMQDVLETFLSTKQEEKEQFSLPYSFDNQEVNDIIKTKEDLHKLRKEYDDLRLNMVQQTCQMQNDDKLNKWKNRVTDLETEVRMLQHEAKCKQEANNFLKNSIQSMEKELTAVRIKAENYRQCHSKDNIELKKKIIELENIIKTQKEIENNLRKNLNDVANIKKSTEISSAFQMNCVTETVLSRCDYSSKHENTCELFKIVQDAVQSAKLTVQDLDSELKKLIREESSFSSVSARSVAALTDLLGKCKEKLDTCCHELSKLKSAVYSKEKLLENLEEVIHIQRDSLTMSQAEVKNLHQKLQDKLDKQSLIITQYEKEKNELLKQNELQIQTIGHLQNAVVEAKRNLDQMTHKTMSDLREKDETIRQLKICIDETQDQYNECFTEATSQDVLLDLQRDAIDSLHKRIRCLEYDKYLNVTMLHTIYNSILNTVQKQMHGHSKDFPELKSKMDFMRAENSSEIKCTRKSCTMCPEDKNCDIQDLEYSSNSITCGMLCMKEYPDDLRYKEVEMDSIAEIQRLKAILCKIQDIDSDLRCKNPLPDHQHFISEVHNLSKKLEHIEQKEIAYKKVVLKLRDAEKEIKILMDQVVNKEEIIRDQSCELESLRNKLFTKDQEIEEILPELNMFEREMVAILCDRIHSLKTLLQERSNNMVKLQADYELLKNENSILTRQIHITEVQAKEDIFQLKKRLSEVQLKLLETEDNCQRITEDFDKTEKQLTTEKESNSQEMIIMEQDFNSKIEKLKDETINLHDLLTELRKELENARMELELKTTELHQTQDKCNNYSDQLDMLNEKLQNEQEELMKIKKTNHDLIHQLQKFTYDNYHLNQEKISLKRNNSIYIKELEDMRNFLLDLKREYHIKDQSLACMSADLNEAAVNSWNLCQESEDIVLCIRGFMEQQKKRNKNLLQNLENKTQLLNQLVYDKKALLNKLKRMKRTNLSLQRLRRKKKELTNKGFKKVYHISQSEHIVTHQKANSGPISSPNYTNDLYKKCFVESIKTDSNISACGSSWCETESNTSLEEESHDYGYQSSSASK